MVVRSIELKERIADIERKAPLETMERLRNYETATAYPGPTQMGKSTVSSISEVGTVPLSFQDLVLGDENWVLGVAARATSNGVKSDLNLARLLIDAGNSPISLWETPTWKPGADDARSRAIGDLVDAAVKDFRLRFNYAGDLQIYGQVKKLDDKALKAEQVDELKSSSPYNDLVPHLDFIPANVPNTSVYFATNLNPTVAFKGSFTYKGYLEIEYDAAAKGLEAAPMKSGKIYASDNPDTLLHAAHKIEDGKRVFIRIFVGPEISRLAETLQHVNDALPLRGEVKPVFTPEEQSELSHLRNELLSLRYG